ncbi:MAG: esterase-like activity of phytase family protein, partial [Ginsengibacter sp.]
MNDYKSLLVSVETPLLQDGPAAGPGDSSAIIRMIKYNIESRKPVGQYAYKIDPVAYPPITPGGFKINGISDILSVDDDKLIVVERSYSTGRLSCTIKVFLADLSGAENIQNIDALKGKKGIKLVSKKLLLNMDNLGIFIDNIEGVTFGPTLSNGKRSLLFIVDNNFNPLERGQVFLFEIE